MSIILRTISAVQTVKCLCFQLSLPGQTSGGEEVATIICQDECRAVFWDKGTKILGIDIGTDQANNLILDNNR